MPDTEPHDRTPPGDVKAQLRQREADLARVQRIGQVGGLDIDVANGMRSFRSPEYLRLHGLPPDRQAETHDQWRDRVHPEDRDRAERTLLAALSGTDDSYDSEYRIVRPSDGEARWIHARADIERDAAGNAMRLVGAHIDVTEQKRMQNALRESEERLGTLLKLMPAAVYTCDAQGQLTFYNQHAAELWGRRPDLGDPQERFCGSYRMWRPDGTLLRHEDCPMADAVLKGRPGRNLEVVIERPDSSRIVANVNIDPLYDANGTLIGAINVFADITERKRAEAALRESEERQAFLLKLSDILRPLSDAGEIQHAAMKLLAEKHKVMRAMFLELDADGDTMTPAARFERNAVPTPSQLRLSDYGPAIADAFRRGETLHVRNTDADAPSEAHRQAYRAIGVGAWIVAPIVKDGVLKAVVAVQSREPRDWREIDVQLVDEIADRTWAAVERASIEGALKDSEERFQQFARASAAGLWIRNAQTLEMEFVSPAIAAIYGIAPGALLGDVSRWTSMIVPEDRELALSHLEQARRGESVSHEFRIRRPSDQTIRWIRNIDFPLRGDGGIPRIGGIAEDITEARLATERQGVLLAELQHRVRNVLTVVRSVFNRSVETSESLQDLADHFQGRIAALARTQLLVTSHPSATADLENLVREELLSVGIDDSEGIVIAGPDVALPPRKAQMFGLALHELTTNALKYGALSVSGGRLDISWEVDSGCGEDRRLAFTWNESGVPAVPIAPARIGFGRELIEQALPYQLDGETELEFRSGGVCCRISLPLGDEDQAVCGDRTRADAR